MADSNSDHPLDGLTNTEGVEFRIVSVSDGDEVEAGESLCGAEADEMIRQSTMLPPPLPTARDYKAGVIQQLGKLAVLLKNDPLISGCEFVWDGATVDVRVVKRLK